MRKEPKPTRPDSELLDRVPPHSMESEKAVLGSLLLDPRRCDDVARVLVADDFHSEANRILYETILRMRTKGTGIDMVTLVESLRQAGNWDAIGGAAYLGEVVHAVPVAAHAVDYAEIVLDKSRRRRLIHVAMRAIRAAWDETTPVMDSVASMARDLEKRHDAKRCVPKQ